MKRPSFLLATTLSLPFSAATSALAQTQIAAPNGWKTQLKTGGARVFTPPDL